MNDWRKAQKIKRTTVCNDMIKWIYWMDCLRVMWELEISHQPGWMMSVDQGKCGQPHDDDIKWKHFLHYWLFVQGILRSPVNSPHKGQWCRALMLSLICALMNNGWVNNREAGDLRCHHAHCDVIVMPYDYMQPVTYLSGSQIAQMFPDNSICEFNISSL